MKRSTAPVVYPGPIPGTQDPASKSEYVHLPSYPEDFAAKRVKAAMAIFGGLVLFTVSVVAIATEGLPDWLGALFLVPSIFLELYGVLLWWYTSRAIARTLPPEPRRVRNRPTPKPATRPLRINGARPAETWLPSRESDRVALAPWGISGVDLMQFLTEAKHRRGLVESAWIGKGVERFQLPSGVAVEFKLFRHLLRCLVENRDAQGRPAPLARKDPRRGWQLTADLEEIKLQLDELEGW